MIRNCAAADCSTGRVILTGGNVVALVLDRAAPDPNALDGTPPVGVLYLTGDDAYHTGTLGALEQVTDMGVIRVSPLLTTGDWIIVTNAK